MPFDQVKQLPDLVGFRLAFHFLKVEEFRNVGMGKNVVTPLDSLDPKAQGFCQPEKIAKPLLCGARRIRLRSLRGLTRQGIHWERLADMLKVPPRWLECQVKAVHSGNSWLGSGDRNKPEIFTTKAPQDLEG
jgi:hypothetical protein